MCRSGKNHSTNNFTLIKQIFHFTNFLVKYIWKTLKFKLTHFHMGRRDPSEQIIPGGVENTVGNIWKNFTLVRRSDCYHLCCKFFIKVSCICFRCNLWLEWRYKLRKEKERIHLQVLAVLFETSRI